MHRLMMLSAAYRQSNGDPFGGRPRAGHCRSIRTTISSGVSIGDA